MQNNNNNNNNNNVANINVGNNNNAGNNENIIMFNPSPGRRSVKLRKRLPDKICDPMTPIQLEFAKIAYESIRFFIKYKSHQSNFNSNLYYDTFIKPKFKNDQLAQVLLKTIVDGTLKFDSSSL